jgi:hypothetical protein
MDKEYFLVVDGEKCGPYQRNQLIEAGLEAESMVWFEGCTVWVRAGKIPDLAALLDDKRKARRQLRKERKVVSQLPSPGAVRWLFRASMFVHVPTTIFFVVGTTALLTALLVGFIISYEQPDGPPRPDSTLVRVYNFSLLTGLIGSGIAVPFVITEAILMALFVMRCRRIVNAVSPDVAEGSLIQEVFEGASLGIPALDIRENLPILFLAVVIGGALILCLVVLAFIILALVIVFMIATLSLLAVGTIYISLASQIHRLTHGLNRVLEHYQIDMPKLSVRLAYFTSLSALLLIFGPLSLPLFVLLPIWAYKTSVVASEICERRREAVEGPPVVA